MKSSPFCLHRTHVDHPLTISEGTVNKLEQIEYHQAHWKASFEKLVSQGKKDPANIIVGVLKGLELAHDIIKEPSTNTQMSNGTTPCIAQAHSVYRINGAKYCKDCGKDLSQ